MNKLIAVLLIISISASLFATPIKYDYEPYEEDEFPLWSVELRRAESIFFGSFVITLPVTALCYSLAESLGAKLTDNEGWLFGQQALIAGGLSLGIALTDFILGRVQQ